MEMSVNNNIICEYVQSDKSIKANISSGFAMIQQKQSLLPLTVVMNAKLTNGDIINKGDVIFVREDHYQVSQKMPFNLPGVDKSLVIISLGEVVFIETVDK